MQLYTHLRILEWITEGSSKHQLICNGYNLQLRLWATHLVRLSSLHNTSSLNFGSGTLRIFNQIKQKVDTIRAVFVSSDPSPIKQWQSRNMFKNFTTVLRYYFHLEKSFDYNSIKKIALVCGLVRYTVSWRELPFASDVTSVIGTGYAVKNSLTSTHSCTVSVWQRRTRWK